MNSPVIQQRYMDVSKEADIIQCTRCLKFIKMYLSTTTREIHCGCRDEHDHESMRDRPDLMRFYKLVEIKFNDTDELERLATQEKKERRGPEHYSDASMDTTFGAGYPGSFKQGMGKPPKSTKAGDILKQEYQAIVEDMKVNKEKMSKQDWIKQMVKKASKAAGLPPQAGKSNSDVLGGIIADGSEKYGDDDDAEAKAS